MTAAAVINGFSTKRTAPCGQCGYALSGLAVSEGEVTCPECGVRQRAVRHRVRPVRPVGLALLVGQPWLFAMPLLLSSDFVNPLVPSLLGAVMSSIGGAWIAVGLSEFLACQAYPRADAQVWAALRLWAKVQMGMCVLAVALAAESLSSVPAWAGASAFIGFGAIWTWFVGLRARRACRAGA